METTTSPRTVTVGGVGPQGPSGPQGPPGVGASWEGVSGEAIGALNAVYLGEDGRFLLWTPALGGRPVGLVSTSSAMAGEPQVAYQGGVLTYVGAGWTTGRRYFVGADGGLSLTPPGAGALIAVGDALSATRLLVSLGEAVQRP